MNKRSSTSVNARKAAQGKNATVIPISELNRIRDSIQPKPSLQIEREQEVFFRISSRKLYFWYQNTLSNFESSLLGSNSYKEEKIVYLKQKQTEKKLKSKSG